MTQKTGWLGASGREFCLCSLEKEDIEETKIYIRKKNLSRPLEAVNEHFCC